MNAVLRGWLPLLVFALLIGTWEGAARLSLVDPMMLPAPSDIAANFIDGFASGVYGHNLPVTLFQALSGFALACAIGISVGSISSFSERFARALQPILIAIEATPKIALAPLIIVWFGYGMGSKVVLATTIAFFPVFIGTVAGLRAAEQGRLDVLRALGASRLQMFRLVALPGVHFGLNNPDTAVRIHWKLYPQSSRRAATRPSSWPIRAGSSPRASPTTSCTIPPNTARASPSSGTASPA